MAMEIVLMVIATVRVDILGLLAKLNLIASIHLLIWRYLSRLLITFI